jgi:ribosomal protein S18 acetylase RimI-like enzyme
VNVRRATADDQATLERLYRDFEAELPAPPFADVDLEQELAEVREIVGEGLAFLSEADGEVLGFVLGKVRPSLGRVTDLYVVPAARRRGIAAALVSDLLDAFREHGVEHVAIDAMAENDDARAVYRRWGFQELRIDLAAPLEHVARHLQPAGEGETFGSIHVQSDNLAAIERAVRTFVPRLPGRSRGSIVTPPRNGWIAVYDDVADRDPRMLRRLARELGDRMGAVVLALGVEGGAVARFILYERGSIVDEYLSVQEYYGELPPGDVIALAANPRVVARLTGADPAAVRAAAVHARTPEELPPPREVLSTLARSMGIEGAEHGWAGAPELPGSIRIDREASV